MIKDDGTVIHFNNPKVQASVPANTFSVTGSAENKRTPLFIYSSTSIYCFDHSLHTLPILMSSES
jgi:hypothetical protein